MAHLREELGNEIFNDLVELTSKPYQRENFLSFNKKKLSIVKNAFNKFSKKRTDIKLLSDFLFFYNTHAEDSIQDENQDNGLLLTYFGYNDLTVADYNMDDLL